MASSSSGADNQHPVAHQVPTAKKIAKKLKKHGDTRIDNYFWMNDRENPEVTTHLEAENAYLEAVMKPTAKLQEKLVNELRARIKEDDESAPYKKGEYYYLRRYTKGSEYPIYARRKNSAQGQEEILLNINELAKGHAFYDASRISVSPDHKQLAYAVDTVGRRFYDVHFKDLARQKTLPDVIKDTTGNIAWLNDNKTVLYSKQDPQTLRSYQIYKYTIGGKKPELIYEEKDDQFYVSVAKSLTQNEVYIECISNSATEVLISPADPTLLDFKVLYKREKKHEYSVIDGGDRYYILTNNKAKNFRLVEVDKKNPARKNWREVVPHRDNVLLENVLVLEKYLVVEERAKGLSQLTHFERGSKKRKSIKFPDATYVTSLGANAEYEATQFRYDYQAMTQPESVYDFDFLTEKTTRIKVAEVPTYDSTLYKSERLWAKAKDGTKIPVSVLYKKSLFQPGQNPLYIYAYGSYGISTDTYFRRDVFSLIDRGFVFAIAHIRGGSDMGRKWYEDGKLLKKKNTFTDFNDVTEYLLKKKYGQRSHVYAMGGSAGGLLMGAIMNMRPDLYNGVIAAVPFVDVVTTMLDDTIPLTTNEYEEWGNPNDLKYYKYIKSYSPYDNVKKQKYPNLLITTGFHDSQVQYWEPAKWLAKLREYNTAANIMIMKTDMKAGHSGTTGRFESLKEDALDFAFFLMLEGIQE